MKYKSTTILYLCLFAQISGRTKKWSAGGFVFHRVKRKIKVSHVVFNVICLIFNPKAYSCSFLCAVSFHILKRKEWGIIWNKFKFALFKLCLFVQISEETKKWSASNMCGCFFFIISREKNHSCDVIIGRIISSIRITFEW